MNPTTLPTKEQGLKSKYIITKTNGKPVDPEAKYFVLRYDRFTKDKEFLLVVRQTLHFFCARLLRINFNKLSQDLHDALVDENMKEGKFKDIDL